MANHRPGRSPGQRFRFEQYVGYLREQGIECDVSFLLSSEDDRLFYAPGRRREKAVMAGRALAQRLFESTRSFLARYDAVYIYREAFFAGPPLIERRLARAGIPFVIDFDDAVWLPGVSKANRWASAVKFSGKMQEIVRLATVVTVGNEYLAGYARERGARRVLVIPTTIDTSHHVPVEARLEGPVTIGWTGSFSTVKYFDLVVPALRRVQDRFGAKVSFALVGDGSYHNAALALRGKPWRLDRELEDLQAFDIGLMPLPDTEWARGKCGFKALQYMGIGIPGVVSPVGVNTSIVHHGVNSLLARGEDEWVDALSRLVTDADLRRSLGAAGRADVVARYSVLSQRARYLELFRSLM